MQKAFGSIIALVFLCLALASCATPAGGPQFKPAATVPGKGTIYV